jgi:hypothetical protein
LIQQILEALSDSDKKMIAVCAIGVLVAGIIFVFGGAKTARGFAGGAGLIAGAIVAAFFLPRVAEISPVIAGVIGAGVGLVVGLSLFRVVQALVLGSLVAVIAGGAFYAVMILPGHPPEVLAPAMKVAQTKTMKSASTVIIESASKEWNAIEPSKQNMLLIVALGAGALAGIVAFIFPRISSIVASAMLGSALCLGSAALLWALYGTAQGMHIQTRFVLISWAFLALLGAAVQCRFYLGRADSSSGNSRQSAQRSGFSPV